MVPLQSISPDGSTIVEPGWSSQSYAANSDGGKGSAQGFQLVASTGTSGYSLTDGTGTILSWAVPDDGLLHRAAVAGVQVVTSGETDGAVALSSTAPGGATLSVPVFSPNESPGTYVPLSGGAVIVKSGSTVTLSQTSALASGASVVYAELWGS